MATNKQFHPSEVYAMPLGIGGGIHLDDQTPSWFWDDYKRFLQRPDQEFLARSVTYEELKDLRSRYTRVLCPPFLHLKLSVFLRSPEAGWLYYEYAWANPHISRPDEAIRIFVAELIRAEVAGSVVTHSELEAAGFFEAGYGYQSDQYGDPSSHRFCSTLVSKRGGENE